MFGLLNIHKPPGPTSHDIVARVRRMLPGKTKVGHAGTLDPFAEGVLVLCVGKATRLAEYVQGRAKAYRAEVTLGATSETDDSQGEVAIVEDVTPPQRSDIEAALERFVGEIRQVPPAHSAVHVDGERAYRLARRGRKVDLPARGVQVHGIAFVRYDWPRLTIDVNCGSGTYIRSLARDIGEALGVGGHCSALTRTAVGDFTLDRARPIDAVDPGRDLLSPIRAVTHLARVPVDGGALRAISQGKRVRCAPPAGTSPGDTVAVVSAEGALAAVAKLGAEGTLRPEKVFLES